jgi:hypothetical protein
MHAQSVICVQVGTAGQWKNPTKSKYCNKIYTRISNGWLTGLPKILAVLWTSRITGWFG